VGPLTPDRTALLKVGRVPADERPMDRLRALCFRLQLQTGQTLAEYGIMVSVIAVVVILAAILFGSSLVGVFSSNATRV
jgi:Flp pilus assembly pilin Flp